MNPYRTQIACFDTTAPPTAMGRLRMTVTSSARRAWSAKAEPLSRKPRERRGSSAVDRMVGTTRSVAKSLVDTLYQPTTSMGVIRSSMSRSTHM